jgi:hypothetical protein
MYGTVWWHHAVLLACLLCYDAWLFSEVHLFVRIMLGIPHFL